jgi:hypothetical protein
MSIRSGWSSPAARLGRFNWNFPEADMLAGYLSSDKRHARGRTTKVAPDMLQLWCRQRWPFSRVTLSDRQSCLQMQLKNTLPATSGWLSEPNQRSHIRDNHNGNNNN